MQNKKRIFVSFFSILFVTIFMLIVCYIKKDQLTFNHYVKEFTQNTLSENTLDLHYTLKEPSYYGIYDTNPLPVYTPKDALTSYDETKENLLLLEKIDPAALSEKQAFTYYVLQDYLKENLELEKYPYYAEPLTPNSGVHTTLPILLAEYTFYSTEDIETYFELLSAIPSYFEGLIQYETEKANAGFFMNSIALDKIVTACKEFSDTDNISSHFMITSFEERLLLLSDSENSISSADIANYSEQNIRLLENSVFPAYKEFALKLTELSQYCNNNYHGLCSFENGKEYYISLLKRNTGSYRSVAEIKEMLFANFEENYNRLITLLTNNPQLLETDCITNFNNHFPLKDTTKILTHLKSAIQADFPPLTALTQTRVKPVSKSLEDYCAPAFYLTVPVDAYEDNVIYINEKNALTGLELYTTLAHEGFPGHLYQTVFFHQSNSRNLSSDTSVTDHLSLLRNTLYYGGYIEGYALYVEALSYDYAQALCQNANLSDATIICDTLKSQWQMQISLYCLLDIAIHYDGATYEQIKALLNRFGIEDETSIREIYQYLLEEPTTYLKYCVGYLEIERLKKLAKSLWLTDYTELAFHKFLLETGPCSFKRLEQKIMEE